MTDSATVTEREQATARLGIRIPQSDADLLRRVSYETRVPQTQLVIEAIRNTYGNK